METIDIKEMLDYFKSKLSIIILITAIVGIIGCLYGAFIQVPKYQSSSTILLIGGSSNESSLTYNDVSLNKNLVGTYSEIVKSKRVLNQVIDNLNLDYNYGKLYGMINVSSVSNTELIKITVTDPDRKKAMEITNETANVFAKEIPELYNISNVNILDEAEEATSPSNVNVLKQSIIFIMVGLVLGLGVVFLIYYFDRTIKSSEQVEIKLGLPVLGTVQEYKKADR